MSDPVASRGQSDGPGRDSELASRALRIDATCDKFERHWRGGRRPAIEDYLAEAQEPERPVLLCELLELELELRSESGDVPGPSEYLERFPGQPAAINLAFGGALSDGRTTSRAGAPGCPPGEAGRFRILRRHARGGLGEVFVARDEQLNREVALKQILDRHADDPVSRSRFLLEAEITGSLEHPGIVPVHGMGLDDRGHPYYAMRFVRGDSFQNAIRGFHADGAPRRNPGERALALQKLLRRFLDVCNAIGYAHTRGVLHRDIKPSNIVVGQHGETIVVDWGLAKAFSAADFSPATTEQPLTPSASSGSAETLPGSALGTPAYMSPEQARDDRALLGPQSDVYSLGATLYCLLTGKPPFEGDDIGAVLRQVQAGTFPRPRALDPRVDRALEATCLKAMATRPDDRYSAPEELAQDIERWLADEPVLAYREAWTVRLSRWGRRHRPLIVGLAALLIAAVFALGISTTLIQREQKQTEAQYRRAESNLQLALNAVDRMLRQVGETELADIPQMEPVRGGLLKDACQFYQKLLQNRGDDPALCLETGRAHSRLGDVLELMGEYDQAEQSYRRAIELLTRPTAADSDIDRQRELARAEHGLGVLLKKANRAGESERFLRTALELRRGLSLARKEPADVRDEKDTLYQLGTLIARQGGRRKEAEAVYREALQAQAEFVARIPDRSETRKNRGRYLNQWGILLEKANPLDAEKAFRAALDIQEKLADEAPTVASYRWALARTSSNLGSVLRVCERISDCENAIDTS